MSYLLEGTEHLEQELTPEPVMAPATGSVILHLALIASVLLYGIIGGFFHHNLWGGTGPGGAIQVNLVSNALPVPTNQPINQNVLSTEKPSEAPAPPQPKAKQQEDQDAIPLQGKPKKPQRETVERTPPQKEAVQNNRASYGEQAGTNMQRATQNFTNGPASVNDANFGSMFPWYVQGIARKMDQNGYRALADPRTPKGARAYIEFTIDRDGSVSNVKLDQSSGSSTWDSVCVRAAWRSQNFGGLPSQYRGSTLQVSYYCEY